MSGHRTARVYEGPLSQIKKGPSLTRDGQGICRKWTMKKIPAKFKYDPTCLGGKNSREKNLSPEVIRERILSIRVFSRTVSPVSQGVGDTDLAKENGK